MDKRWIMDGHFVEDRVTGIFYQSKDKLFIDIVNILYNEIQELKEKK